MNQSMDAAVPLYEQPAVYARRWQILAVMCLSLILVVMAVSGLNVAIPAMAQDLSLTGTELLWVVDSYAIVFASLLLIAGALGDRYGRKEALEGGLIVFALGAIYAAFGSDASQVIAGRAIMGAGAAFIMPATLSIISVVFPHRANASGPSPSGPASPAPAVPSVRSSAARCSPVSAPSARGAGRPPSSSTCRSSWACSIAVYLISPRSKESVPTPLDPVGGVLSIVAITALLFAIIQGPEEGWTSTVVLGAFAIAAVVSVVIHLVGASPGAPDAADLLLPQPALLGRCGRGDVHVHGALRLLPAADPVRPVRARVHAAGGRAWPRCRPHSRSCSSHLDRRSWPSASAPVRSWPSASSSSRPGWPG